MRFITRFVVFAAASIVQAQAVAPSVDQVSTVDAQIKWVQKHNVAEGTAIKIVNAAYEAAHEFNVDPLLLLAVAKQESTFRPLVVSRDGSKGVWQIREKVHHVMLASLGVSNVFQVRGNARASAYLLSCLLENTKGNLRKALYYYSGKNKKYAAQVISKIHEVPLVYWETNNAASG